MHEHEKGVKKLILQKQHPKTNFLDKAKV